jgi:phosphonate transport system substrate-binding protein
MRLLFYFLLCVCFNFACSAQNVLYIGVGSNISKSAESQQTAEELAAYFSQKMGIPVKINSLRPGKTLEQIQEGKLDIALMNTFGYVLASSEGNMEGLVVVANDKKEAISYKSCILAHPSTKITNPNELKKEASKHIFGFVTASSTSGHLVPRLYLNRLDLQPEISFRDVVFAGSHKDLIQKVSTNDIRVGATSYTDLEQLTAEGKYKKEQFNVIWISEPIVNGPVSVRKDLPEATKKKLQEIWLALPAENPSLNKKIVKFWHNTDEKSIFIPAQNSLYDSIKKMADSMEEISLLVGLYSE